MPYYQNRRVVQYHTSPHWFVFVGEHDEQFCYCISRTSKTGAIVEYWDGCEKLSIEELDLACDTRVAEIKIAGEDRITLKNKVGDRVMLFAPFF